MSSREIRGSGIQHRCVSVRYIDSNGCVTDLVQCEICGSTSIWTSVDPKSDIPRSVDERLDCGEKMVGRVMNS